MEVFDRSDSAKRDEKWLPWGQRHFPALYRLFYVHDGRVEEALSEVMLSSEGLVEDD